MLKYFLFYLQIQKEIYSLRPNTYYRIQIWASNEIGDGVKTELTTKTLSDMIESGKILFYLIIVLLFDVFEK
jgi:hypothetical protein